MQGKIWAKIHKKSKIVKDAYEVTTKEDTESSLREICKQFDVSVPMWSNKNHMQWEEHNITRFFKDDFIDDFPYDNLEISFIADKK